MGASLRLELEARSVERLGRPFCYIPGFSTTTFRYFSPKAEDFGARELMMPHLEKRRQGVPPAGYPGITRPGVYPGITRDNPKQKTCNGISQYRNLVLGYPEISWDIPLKDNSVQDGI